MNARLFIKRNSATILSFVAVAGVVATAITSANATPKAVRALDTAKLNKGEEELTKIEFNHRKAKLDDGTVFYILEMPFEPRVNYDDYY